MCSDFSVHISVWFGKTPGQQFFLSCWIEDSYSPTLCLFYWHFPPPMATIIPTEIQVGVGAFFLISSPVVSFLFFLCANIFLLINSMSKDRCWNDSKIKKWSLTWGTSFQQHWRKLNLLHTFLWQIAAISYFWEGTHCRPARVCLPFFTLWPLGGISTQDKHFSTVSGPPHHNRQLKTLIMISTVYDGKELWAEQ